MIDEIEKTILADAEKQKSEILKKAGAERGEKLEEAKADIEKEKKRLLAKGLQEAEREKQRLTSEANLEAKRNLLRAKEDLISSVLEKARDKLESHTKEKGYGGTLDSLVAECHKELGKDAVIYLRKADTKHIHGSKEMEMGAGVIAESKDGGLYLDNTFDMRLKRNTDQIRKEIGGILFK